MFLLCWFFHFVTVISTILKDEREMSVQCHMSSIVNYIEKKEKKESQTYLTQIFQRVLNLQTPRDKTSCL